MSESNAARSAAAWPPRKIARLTFLVQAGMHSFSEIGEIMGIGKNAAIGKAHRLGLKGPRMRGPKGAEPSTLTSRLDALDVFPRFGKCVFLLGERGAFHCCGVEVPADNVLSPFCEVHKRVAWQASKPRPHLDSPEFVSRRRA